MLKHICFKFLKKIYMIMDHFPKYRLFLGWFQVMSVVSWLSLVVLNGFRSFQVVSPFTKCMTLLQKIVLGQQGAYPENSVGKGELGK